MPDFFLLGPRSVGGVIPDVIIRVGLAGGPSFGDHGLRLREAEEQVGDIVINGDFLLRFGRLVLPRQE